MPSDCRKSVNWVGKTTAQTSWLYPTSTIGFGMFGQFNFLSSNLPQPAHSAMNIAGGYIRHFIAGGFYTFKQAFMVTIKFLKKE
jgi:hypothetical protein